MLTGTSRALHSTKFYLPVGTGQKKQKVFCKTNKQKKRSKVFLLVIILGVLIQMA